MKLFCQLVLSAIDSGEFSTLVFAIMVVCGFAAPARRYVLPDHRASD